MKKSKSKLATPGVDSPAPKSKGTRKKSTRKSTTATPSTNASASASTTPIKRAKRTTKKSSSATPNPTPVETPGGGTTNTNAPGTPLQGAYQQTTAPPPTAAQQKPPPKEKELEYPEDVISSIMYTFGDVKKPITETVKSTEQFVKRYLNDLVQESAEVYFERMNQSDQIPATLQKTPASEPQQTTSSKSKKKVDKAPQQQPSQIMIASIEMQDVLFALRHKPVKLKRIEYFMRRMEEQASVEALKESTSGDSKKRKRITALVNTVADFSAGCKRLKRYDGLFGDMKVKDTDENEHDEGQSKQALHQLAKLLLQEDFIEYSKCRDVSFINHGNYKKFITWLNLPKQIRLADEYIVEVLAHLAWEAVGTITQASLIVKRDVHLNQTVKHSQVKSSGMDYFSASSFYNTTGLMNAQVEILFGRASGVISDDFRKIISSDVNSSYFGGGAANAVVSSGQQLKPITATHVLEAVRRLRIKKML
ncbi:transcription initiation protein SPT3 [Acrasis kona]|uniref:Transcription initiation protein SPT3 n=1 Tax=Acrasis kona TaxID=1008807 RepID=A0AAW2ZJN5_9EUKA